MFQCGGSHKRGAGKTGEYWTFYLLFTICPRTFFFVFLYISIHVQDFLDIQYDYFVLKQC